MTSPLLCDFDAGDLTRLELFGEYVRNPSQKRYIFLGERVFQCDILVYFSHRQQAQTVKLTLTTVTAGRVTSPEEHCFSIELKSISSFDHRFIACAGQTVLVQFYTEPSKNVYDVISYCLHLESNTARVVPNLAVIARGYGGDRADFFYFTDVYRSSLLNSLDTSTHQQKVLKACVRNRWIAQVLVHPSDEQLLGVASDEAVDFTNPSVSGWLALYNTRTETITHQRRDLTVCTELLLYAHSGDVTIAYAKYPATIYCLASDSLDVLQQCVFHEYCPFLHLPLNMPDFVYALHDEGTLRNIQAAKVVIRKTGLRGCSLDETKIRFLFPIVSKCASFVRVLHYDITGACVCEEDIMCLVHQGSNLTIARTEMHNDGQSMSSRTAESVTSSTAQSVSPDTPATEDLLTLCMAQSVSPDTAHSMSSGTPASEDSLMSMSSDTSASKDSCTMRNDSAVIQSQKQSKNQTSGSSVQEPISANSCIKTQISSEELHIQQTYTNQKRHDVLPETVNSIKPRDIDPLANHRTLAKNAKEQGSADPGLPEIIDVFDMTSSTVSRNLLTSKTIDKGHPKKSMKKVSRSEHRIEDRLEPDTDNAIINNASVNNPTATDAPENNNNMKHFNPFSVHDIILKYSKNN